MKYSSLRSVDRVGLGLSVSWCTVQNHDYGSQDDARSISICLFHDTFFSVRNRADAPIMSQQWEYSFFKDVSHYG